MVGGIRVGKGQMEGWEENAARTKAAAADCIAHLKRGATTIMALQTGATTIMALQKWGGRGSDDIGGQCCVKNDVW